jgi:two-component system cell cycle sensor histidine kinase/response regulator CckA
MAGEQRGGAEESGRRAVLLIDDEQQCLLAGERLLGLLGYDGILASSGAAAVDLFQEHRERIDLVILDLIMPFMDGAETFRRLKAVDSEVRIMIASGYIKDDMKEQLDAAGAAGFLSKPFDFEKFETEVKRALNR